jgi:glycosyltransferase involved in cell wall biosynthesis
MIIGIDARMLGPKCGGLGRYVEQLISHLLKLDTNDQYVLFLKKDNWDLVEENTRVKKVLTDIHWYGWKEQTKFVSIIKKEKIDLMHFPHWNVPLLYNRPFVVTIHDLLLMHYPTRAASKLGPVLYWIKQLAYKLTLKLAAKKAKHIIVPSEYTKQDVVETLGVASEKISVTYEAPFSVIASEAKKSKYDDKKYILYVGVAYPHKNLEGLLESWKKFQTYEKNYELILVGKKNFFYERIQEKIDNDEINNVRLTGFVSDEELHELYAGASLYVFPSLYEGFGLPPLEAMQHGIPVVSSNRTCMPEILGEGALYADPENHDQFADAMYRALTDEDVRFELKSKAREELKRFSWADLARKTSAIYRHQKKA